MGIVVVHCFWVLKGTLYLFLGTKTFCLSEEQKLIDEERDGSEEGQPETEEKSSVEGQKTKRKRRQLKLKVIN